MTIILRPYQIKALDDVRAAYRSGKRAPLLVSPTGSGKTVMFSSVANGVKQRGKRVIILCHRSELIEQIDRALRDVGLVPGIISADRAESPRAPVQVASVMTLIRRLERTPPPDLIICDEAHHCIASSSWGRVIGHWPQALVLGVTATPIRLSGEGLDDVFDTLVQGPTVQELIGLGALSPVTVYAPPGPDLSGVHMRMGEYIASELSEVMSKSRVVGDAVEHYTRHAAGRPAIAFCVSVKHATAVAEQFRKGGYTSVSIDGSLDGSLRRTIVRDFTAGRINVLTSCDLISEGFDVPRVEVGLLLRPTKSTGLYLQQCGRVLRPFPGKERALILDHAGNTLKHGLPTAHREWSLAGRVVDGCGKAGDREVSSVRVCGRCFAANASTRRECGECGELFEVKGRSPSQLAGTLREIHDDGVPLAAGAGQAQRRTRAPNAANDLAGLIALGEMRGYRNPAGWAKHILEAREKKKAALMKEIQIETP